MNIVHEQCPNSDPKQCTVTKLGWVHSAHTQNPGRTHTARAVPRSWALLRLQLIDHAHVTRTASAGRPLAGRALVATRPGSLPQVATSNRCRDQPLLLPQKRPCRDPKPWLRHQTTTRQPEPCRDIKSVS